MSLKRPRPPILVLGSVVIELRGDQLLIYPNRPDPGTPVTVAARQLESWAKRIYRNEVVR